MKRYQAGDESAFNELYGRYNRRVYGYLSQRGLPPELMDDAFQETFQRLHRHLHRYDSRYPFAPWLFTICRNALVDCLRKRGRVADREQGGGRVPEGVSAPTESAPELPSLDRLSPDQRQAVEMRYLKESTFEEIAKTLKTSPANARQLVSRALKRLRKAN